MGTIRGWLLIALAVSMSWCLSGCAAGVKPQPSLPFASISGAEPRAETFAGFEALEKGDYSEASRYFNRAIQLDPTNSRLQFLNGLTYHLQAVKGDQSQYAFAEQGYRLANKFDPSNWLAHYYCGLLYMDQKRYKEAQDQLAEVLLFTKDRPDVYYAMLVASYYAHDLETSAAMLGKVEEREGRTARVKQSGAMISAAVGQFENANNYLADLATDGHSDQLVVYLKKRLEDWRGVHGALAVREPVSSFVKGDLQTVAYSYADSTESRAGGTDYSSDQEAALSVEDAIDNGNMIIVDVVIIRTEENISTRKGVNLLNGLSVQFGDSSNSAYQYSVSRDWASLPSAISKTITKSLSIPMVEYSLNIANAHSDRNEILARPSLVALDGQMSEFFSGTHIFAASVASSSGGDGESVSIEDDIGVKLQVTPELLDGNMVKLEVMAERTFLKTPSQNVVFDNKVETSKTRVSAFVEMNLDDTLILSGMSEKETERIRDGVPFLQSIPLVQYFFSQKDTRDFQRSVLILLTPRLPEYVYSKKSPGQPSGASSTRLNELKARYSDWFQPYPNWASVFHHLQSNSLYREFRTGDVTLERWESQSTLIDNLKQAFDYLYF